MSKKAVAVLLAAFAASAIADDEARFPRDATFTTKIVTPLAIEGLTGDGAGNLYTTGRDLNAGDPCPVWRINIDNPSLVTVGFIPNVAGVACNPSGIAFDEAGNLYVADGGAAATVWKVTPSVPPRPVTDTIAFATGVPGTNGLAFDRDGNLWTGDATTGQGRVWRISPSGGNCQTEVGCKEMFRIQPMANDVIAVTGPGDVVTGGVGRDVRTLPPGTIFIKPPAGTAVRSAANTGGSQPLVANGLAFDRDGDLYVADTARGAIWKVQLDRSGELKSSTGCDKTFTDNTLCLDNVYVAHPYLEGTDGIVLDRAGNIWNSANERNAIVVVTRQRHVVEVFRNPARKDPGVLALRNEADVDVGNNHILEFPTSPVLEGRTFCSANSDGNRRDNSPSSAGEINSGNAAEVARGKISCMDQDVRIQGIRLPVR